MVGFPDDAFLGGGAQESTGRRGERRLIIALTYTGSTEAAYDAARRVLDAGVLQDAMHEMRSRFHITDAEIK